MLEETWEAFHALLGLGLTSHELTVGQVALRAAIVYIAILIGVRVGARRFLAKITPVDFLLAILLGSIASRAITGNSPFFPTLAAVVSLLALHWLIARIALRSHRIGKLVKGEPRAVVKDGVIVEDALRRSGLTERDLLELLRLNGGTDGVERVPAAYIERNGELSVIKEARVLEIKVEDGVQTVRLQL